jgi:magnesium-transporting ATPase (P-type)
MKNKFLFNDRIIVRFISLFVISAILFTAVWYLSYYFLPEGILQGKTGSAIIVGSEVAPTMLEEWGKIVLFNLAILFLIILVNLIRYLDKFPLGYITPLGMIALYAVFLGTNSFSIPMAERMAPTLAVFSRGGPYEMIAFILIAVATYNQSRFALTQDMHSLKDIPRISPVPRMSLEQWGGIGLAIALILLAGWREAAMIMAL